MIKFSRNNKNSVTLSLDNDGLHQLKQALEVALNGEPSFINVELSGRVVGKRWSIDTQTCPCLISHISLSELDEMIWDWQSKTLKLNIDTDSLEAGIYLLTTAIETGCFWPSEWLNLDSQKRPEMDLISFKLISPPDAMP